MNLEAKVFGYILGDGWIDIHEQCGAGGDAESLINLKRDIDLLYGKGSSKKITTRSTYSEKYGIYGTTSQFITDIKTSRKIQKLGMPIGRRTSQAYLLPKWIYDGDVDTKISFFSGYYAAEGLIPEMQKNKRTPHALEFMFHKDSELIDNARELAKQFLDILRDIGLNGYITESFVVTNKEKVKEDIVISNSEELFVKALNLLDLDYCLKKEEQKEYLKTYFSLKQKAREHIRELHQRIIQERAKHKTSYKKLGEKFGLSWRQVEKIFNGRSSAKQVRNFPRFDQDFVNTYCLSKTPLNDETL